jgi:hypothetical protein
VAVSSRLSHLHWIWKLGVLALLIGCLAVIAVAASQHQTSTVVATSHAPVTSASYPTSISSDTPVTRQTTGVFPLSAGGPIPVPANVLHPTNVARMVIHNVLTSIYAGSMTRMPAIGALAILREDLTTGEQSLHIYSTTQAVGAITILAVHDGIIMLSTPKARGTFDPGTGQFRFF